MPSARYRAWWPILLIGAGTASLMAVVVSSGWLSDDYYFSLKAARLLVDGYGLQHNAAERVQGFSNPLWTLLLAGNFLLSDQHYVTTLVLSFLVTLGVALILATKVARTTGGALLGLVILASSKAFVDYSSSGLENPLGHLLFISFLATWYATPFPRDRSGRLSLLAALLICTRLDLSLLVLPHLLLLLLRPAQDRSGRLRLMAGMLPLAAWLCFALLYYGSPFPNTAWAKLTSEEGIRLPLMVRGWTYLADSLVWDRLTLPVIAAAILAAFIIKPRSRSAATVAGVLLYMVYIVWIGGDFMAGRFMTLPLVGAVAILVRVTYWRRPLITLTAILLAVGVSLGSDRSPLRFEHDITGLENLVTGYNVADERLYYYPRTGVLSRWKYGILLKDLDPMADLKEPVRQSEDGVAAYVVNPGTHMVNRYGLTDPLLVRLPTRDFAKARAGHYRRKLPEGYFESLRTGKNKIKDQLIAALWDDLVLATRAPIFAEGRFAAMWRLHSGFHTLVWVDLVK